MLFGSAQDKLRNNTVKADFSVGLPLELVETWILRRSQTDH